jgi:hypothetical protein
MKEQRANESQKLWCELTEAIKKNDLMAASKAKFEIEEEQRKIRQKYEDEKLEWKPKFFKQKKGETNVKAFWEFIGADTDEYKEIYELTKSLKKKEEENNKDEKKEYKENNVENNIEEKKENIKENNVENISTSKIDNEIKN